MKYKCENCNWQGNELTKEGKLPNGLTQMAGCCPTCGESIEQKGDIPADPIKDGLMRVNTNPEDKIRPNKIKTNT